MGMFQRALIGELTSNGLLVFAVLLGIVVVSQLIRLLGMPSVAGSPWMGCWPCSVSRP